MYLEDLIVTERYRRWGIGRLLFKELIQIARRKGARRLSWQVLEWNEPAIKFYKKALELNPKLKRAEEMIRKLSANL